MDSSMMIFILRPFTSAEPGTFAELLEVLAFTYLLLSLVVAPALWLGLRGMDEPNRLRRYLTLVSVPFIWSIVVIVWGVRSLASYLELDFRRELQDLIPKRKAAPALRSPNDLGLWD